MNELAGQKACQAAGKAQEGRVDAKVELQLGYPILVITSSLGLVFLTLHTSHPCSVAPPCQPPVCDKSLRGWAGGEHHWYPTNAQVLLALSSPFPEFLLLLLGKRRGFVGYRESLADFPPLVLISARARGDSAALNSTGGVV